MSAKRLAVSQLCKHYGGVQALRSVDLAIEPGEVHGIIGPNGAGKSTLVDIISGFTPRSSGTIQVDDAPVVGSPHSLARVGIARTFQHTSLFHSETVERNLHIARACLSRWLVGRRSRRTLYGIAEALDLVGLAGERGTVASALSYGAQRRLALAVALMSTPDILLLDEPAAGMNPSESNEFVDLVRSIRAERTIVLIEHDMSVVRSLCERSTVLVDGEVLTSGPTTTVLDDPRVVDVYLGATA